MDRGPLDMLVQIVHAGKTGAVLPEQSWPERTRHVTSENGWAHDDHDLAARGRSRQRAQSRQRRTIVDLLWDMASIHASEATLAAMRATFPHVVLCFLPPQSTSYLQPCDVAVFRSFKSCIQAQASATLTRSVLDGSFDGLAMNKAWRRQSSAEWACRAVTDLCEKDQAWTTGWSRLRAHSDDEFEAAVAEAAALHVHDELYAKHVEPEPAPEDPVDWAMAEATDGEDDAPMPDAPPEAELIDMPPAPASAPHHDQFEALHRSAPRVRLRTTMSLVKNAQPSSYHILFSVVTRARCPVCVSPCCLTRPLSSFCVSCPGFPDFFEFFFGEEGKSDGFKWCPHKVISAHMLACTSGNRPCSSESARVFLRMLGYVLHGQPTVI